MLNRHIVLGLMVLLISTGLPTAGNSAQPVLESEPLAGEMDIIDPGEAVRCKKDFIVENLDSEPADLKVVLGNKVYVDEILAPGETRAFSLAGTLFVAKHHGRDVSFNTEAIIINLGPTSKMRSRCLSLKKNPLRGEDGLQTFK
ncbi:MAG: hypothetical protein ACE5ER_06665 [Nitrospinaceae bacterium]